MLHNGGPIIKAYCHLHNTRVSICEISCKAFAVSVLSVEYSSNQCSNCIRDNNGAHAFFWGLGKSEEFASGSS